MTRLITTVTMVALAAVATWWFLTLAASLLRMM